MKYCYCRVSTVEQNLDRQLEAMKKYDIPKENYFVEKASAKDTNRPELQKLLSIVKEGDTIHIHDFSRLSRSTSDLLKIVERLTEQGVHLISMIGAIYEFERANLLERQKEGTVLAKQRGAFNKKDIDRDLAIKLKADVEKGLISVKDAAKQLGFSRQYWYRYIKTLES